STAIVGVHADIRSVQPLPIRPMGCQPSSLDDLGEGVSQMGEIKVQPESRRRAYHSVCVPSQRSRGTRGVDCHELAFGKQLHVMSIMRRLETLIIGKRRKT